VAGAVADLEELHLSSNGLGVQGMTELATAFEAGWGRRYARGTAAPLATSRRFPHR
jgi:hypothetical protein